MVATILSFDLGFANSEPKSSLRDDFLGKILNLINLCYFQGSFNEVASILSCFYHIQWPWIQDQLLRKPSVDDFPDEFLVCFHYYYMECFKDGKTPLIFSVFFVMAWLVRLNVPENLMHTFTKYFLNRSCSTSFPHLMLFSSLLNVLVTKN